MSLVLAAAVGVISAPCLAAAAKPSKNHHHKKKALTAKDIRAAVARAEHSPDLWATVNECMSATAVGDVVGIRGQMPSLGFPTTLSMDISVSYWNGNAFVPVPAKPGQPATTSKHVDLGKATHGLHQTGVNFPFVAPTSGTTLLMRGTITFEWAMGTKVIGKVTRNTGHGYANVGFSNPPGYSAGTCTLT